MIDIIFAANYLDARAYCEENGIDFDAPGNMWFMHPRYMDATTPTEAVYHYTDAFRHTQPYAETLAQFG